MERSGLRLAVALLSSLLMSTVSGQDVAMPRRLRTHSVNEIEQPVASDTTSLENLLSNEDEEMWSRFLVQSFGSMGSMSFGGSGTLSTGQSCSKNGDCISNTCRNGACMATSDCFPLKHEYGTPFDTNKVNLVFVASKFDSTTNKAWRAQVKETFGVFADYNMFSEGNPLYNAFFVDPEDLSPSFCFYNCGGIDRLLCCDLVIARELSSRCFPAGGNLQTIVVHNDMKYGGAGYFNSNVATTSINPSGTLVAVHELGHSLFELEDEYTYGGGTSAGPNCDATDACSKWSDLIGMTPNGYNPVSCVPGCMDAQYFVGELSFMNSLRAPVGAVNERFTCCTYQALTKAMPSYCRPFEFSEDYVFDYCKNNDYQRYGSENYGAPALASSSHDLPSPSSSSSGRVRRTQVTQDDPKYINVNRPMLVSIGLSHGDDGAGYVLGSTAYGPAGLYRKGRVFGDFSSMAEAAEQGMETVVRVTIHYTTKTEEFYMAENTTVGIIPPLEEEVGESPESEESFVSGRSLESYESDDGNLEVTGSRSVSLRADILELALDIRGLKLVEVRVEVVQTAPN